MNNESSDNQYDVIVVGSGGGLIGAYAAAARGLKTLLIEKTSHVGGTTSWSGSGIWLPGNAAETRAGIENSVELAREYLDAIVGADSPVALREAFLQGGARMIDDLESNPTFGTFNWRGIPDYFADAPGALPQGRTIFPENIERSELGDLEPLVRRPIWTERWGVEAPPTMIGGQALIGRALLAFMQTGNGTVRTDTGLTDLIVEDGAVVGVIAVSNGESVTFRATRGVLLAAGGFERNAALREKYQPVKTVAWTQGCEGNTGDALQAAMAIGADTDLLDEAWYTPGLVVPDTHPVFYTSVWSGIWVNGAGQRFMNERLPYDRSGHEILRAELSSEVEHLPTHWVFDQRQIDNQLATENLPVPPQVPGWFDVERFIEAGVLKRADTLDELAELIGVPAGNLTKTVEQYNAFARGGTDEQFHRGETEWDLFVNRLTGGHTDGSNPCLGVIDRGPFYAAQIVLSDLGTKGGLRTDGRARVLRSDDSPIAGLYAAGNTMAPVTGRIYPGAGGPVGSSMTFSWLAAIDMAGEE